MENKNKNRFLEANPNKILLKKSSESASSTAIINLKNITNNYVAFKSFMNRNACYVSVPNIGYILPGENLNVTIKKIEKVYNNIYNILLN